MRALVWPVRSSGSRTRRRRSSGSKTTSIARLRRLKTIQIKPLFGFRPVPDGTQFQFMKSRVAGLALTAPSSDARAQPPQSAPADARARGAQFVASYPRSAHRPSVEAITGEP